MAHSGERGVTCDGPAEPAAILAMGALISVVVCGLAFCIAPALDLIVARFFFTPGQGFIGQTNSVEVLREGFKLLYIVACLMAIGGLVAALLGRNLVQDITRVKWVYLCLCLSIGPGVVCNVAFKDQWGRARPHQIVEFGGNKHFTPALLPARQCDTNCSFTCGEASSIFMVFFALSLLLRRWFKPLALAGFVLGSVAGLIRMAQGGHFLSDVLFAGVMMALIAVALDQLIDAFEAPEGSARGHRSDSAEFESRQSHL